MMNANRRKQFRTRLMDWYTRHGRSLPWRETDDPYRIWVSEVMAQQTRIQTVIPYYQRFLEKFPDIESLARSDLQTVLKLWEGLGYYGRARNFHAAAKAVADKFNGRVPDDPDAFKRLKGVGDYICAAVTSIAFGRPLAVVDGNVKRVLARIFEIDAPVNVPSSYKRFGTLAGELLDTAHPGRFNQAMMELGALVCRPRNPPCEACPVQTFCRAFKSGRVEGLPKRTPRTRTPEYHIAVGVVRKNGRMLITRRRNDGLLGGLWEFPGGKVKPGETAEDACIREIAEETGLVVRVETHLTHVRHAYTHFKIRMDVFICRYESGRVALSGPEDSRWIRPEGTDRYPFPGANRKFIPLLREQLAKQDRKRPEDG